MMLIRRQLPAYSPVKAAALPGLLREVLHLGSDPRPRLISLLQREYAANEVLLCGSGTQALTLAIRAALNSVETGSTVALPAFSCFDVATAAVGADAAVGFYDLDPDTLGPDLGSLERALKERAKVVVAAPLYGMPVDWEPLRDLCDAYGAILIEDAAQGNGASWRGCRLGALGEISVLSFGRGKGWTGGTGGALLIRGQRAIVGERLRESGLLGEIRNAVKVLAQYALARPVIYGIPASIPALQLGETVYREPSETKVLSRTAAIAIAATWEDLQREADQRRANAKILAAGLSDVGKVQLIRTGSEALPGYLRFPLRLPCGMDSFSSRSDATALGIAASYPQLLADLPQIQRRSVAQSHSYPGARTLVGRLITLPTHSRLRPDDLAKIVALTARVVR